MHGKREELLPHLIYSSAEDLKKIFLSFVSFGVRQVNFEVSVALDPF